MACVGLTDGESGGKSDVQLSVLSAVQDILQGMFDIFFKLNPFFFVFSGLAVAVFFLGFQEGAGRMILIRDLGIPLGLTGSLIGAIQAMNGILLNGSGEGVYSATAVMLLTTLYGGAASAVGYFFSGAGRPQLRSIKHPRRLVIGKWLVLVNLLLFFGYAMEARGPSECVPYLFGVGRSCGGFAWFYEPMVFAIFAGGVLISLIKSKPGYYAANLSKSFLLSAMICVTCGIILLFSGETLQGLSVAGVGLVWGLMSFIFVYVSVFSTPQAEPINANLFNWHWMEVTAFYIFMFFAPDTILDNFQEEDVADRFESLEQKMEDLERELDVLRLR